jgi:hypothetical protein
MDVIKPVVDDMSWASGIMFQDRMISVADASPLLLLWAYQAITIYRRLEQRYGDEVQGPLALMKEKLRIMSRRWKVGGKFMLQLIIILIPIHFRSLFANLRGTRNHWNGCGGNSMMEVMFYD